MALRSFCNIGLLALFLFSLLLPFSSHAAIYSGNFYGDDHGTWAMSLDSQGQGKIYIWSSLEDEGECGVVQRDEDGQVYGSLGNGCTISGFIDFSGNFSGLWECISLEASGTLSGHQSPDEALQNFSGNFSGNFWGDDHGSLNFWIGVNGVLSGNVVTDDNESYPLSGLVTGEGRVFACTHDGASLYGTISNSGSAMGDWYDPTEDDEGSFNAQRMGASWRRMGGSVKSEFGAPICAMVLANGQYQFSELATGKYDFSENGVPLDENGRITVFAFADGFAPFKQTITPEEAENFEITMYPAAQNTPEIHLTIVEEGPGSVTGWVHISGQVTTEDGTPICAMVLANGQYQFSDSASGAYDFSGSGVPLDANGEITIFAFADGFKPFKLQYRVTGY